jgi:hypothetical protein
MFTLKESGNPTVALPILSLLCGLTTLTATTSLASLTKVRSDVLQDKAKQAPVSYHLTL